MNARTITPLGESLGGLRPSPRRFLRGERAVDELFEGTGNFQLWAGSNGLCFRGLAAFGRGHGVDCTRTGHGPVNFQFVRTLSTSAATVDSRSKGGIATPIAMPNMPCSELCH